MDNINTIETGESLEPTVLLSAFCLYVSTGLTIIFKIEIGWQIYKRYCKGLELG